MIEYIEVLENVKEWVKEVGIYQKEQLEKENLIIHQKDTKINYVTNIDIESEKRITQSIKHLYPEHSIVGEEMGYINKHSDYVWVIDPIDGTTSFIHGFPMYSISVALKYRGETKIGVVYAPLMNMCFTGIQGNGAYLNDRKIKVSETKELIYSLISTGFQYYRDVENTNLKYFSSMINQIADIRRTGSAALDLCLTAAGSLDGYWEFDLNEWDIAAGALILEEAGGQISCLQKSGHNLAVCGNLVIHDLLLDALNKADLQ